MPSPFILKAEGGTQALDRAEVLRALGILIDPQQTFELRGITTPHATSRVCSGKDLSAAVEAAWELSSNSGVYFTLNPLAAGLTFNHSARDRDVISRRLILIDVDAIRTERDSGCSESEKECCRQLITRLLDHLSDTGWPAPIIIDSGNGFHLVYRVDLPSDKLSQQLVKAVLVQLADRFDTNGAKIDRAVHNAARISKLPGTWARKGQHTDERPHRLSKIVWAPDVLEVVTIEQLRAVAGQTEQPKPETNGTHSPFAKVATNGQGLDTYVRSAVEKECGRLCLTMEGDRDNQTNKSAFCLGTMAAWPEMDSAWAKGALFGAARQTGLDEPSIRRAINSGWTAGAAEPRTRPVEQEPYRNGTTKGTFKASDKRDATVADLAIADAGTRWLWKGWIPLGVLTLLTAEPSTGKTRLGLDLTKRIVLNLPWPDGQAMELHGRKSVVIWVPADNQHSELVDCSAAFGFPGGSIVLNTTIDNIYGGTELVEQGQLDDLQARIERHTAALVLIDTITNTSDAKSQDTSDAKRQYKPLQDVAKRTGAAVMCVTHTNIAGKTLGRRADEKTRVTIRLTCPDPERQPTRRRLEVALTRLSEKPAPLGITMGDDGNQYDNQPPETPAEGAGFQRPTKLPSTSVQEAIGFLSTVLRTGPERVSTLRDLCEHREPPIDAKQLYAARKYLPIEEYEQEDVLRRKPYKWWKLLKQGDEQIPDDGPAY